MKRVGVPAEDIVGCRRPLSRGYGSGCELIVMMCGGSGLRRLMKRVERLRVRVRDGRHRVEVV